jgi:hypothetical protein
MACRWRVWWVGGVACVAAILLGAAPASAKPFDLQGDDDLTVDLTTSEDPVLTLVLERSEGDSDVAEVVVRVTAGVPLGQDCDFVATDGLPEAVGDDAAVKFTIRDADRCDLAGLDADEVTIASPQIDDVNATVALKREPSFPLNEYVGGILAGVLTAVIVVGVATAIAWRTWSISGKKGRRFWRHQLDSPTLTWSFNDSWLTNLTALGALLATLLGLTDVLDVIGPEKPDRAVFLLVNFAGLALAATSLIAYLALRGYKLTEDKPARVPLRLELQARQETGGARRLEVTVPTVTYADESGTLAEPPVETGLAKHWLNSGHHVVVLAVPSQITGRTESTPPPPSFVALEVPSAGTHAPNAILLYDTSVPRQKRDGTSMPATYVSVTEPKDTVKAHGRMLGFVTAGLLAATGVAIQLAATYSVLARADLSEGANYAGYAILVVLAAFAAVYVFTTIVKRLPEVDSTEPPAAPATSTLPRHMIDQLTGEQPMPVVPAATINVGEGQVEAVEGYEPVTLTSVEDLGAVSYPTTTWSYAPVGTSPGDQPLARTSRETAF